VRLESNNGVLARASPHSPFASRSHSNGASLGTSLHVPSLSWSALARNWTAGLACNLSAPQSPATLHAWLGVQAYNIRHEALAAFAKPEPNLYAVASRPLLDVATGHLIIQDDSIKGEYILNMPFLAFKATKLYRRRCLIASTIPAPPSSNVSRFSG
jgi:hypothetical protein